jgi:DNA-binding transcriptional ArsR family regulator
MRCNPDLTFKALGDGTRRAILDHLLAEGELSSGALVARFASAQPTISKHLKVLETAGLIQSRSSGRNRLYRVEPGALRPVADWLTRHATLWSGSLDRLGRLLDESSR